MSIALRIEGLGIVLTALIAAAPVQAGPVVLAAPTIHAVANAPRLVFAGDINGDGLADLAVLGTTTPQVSVMLGVGGGAFAPAVAYLVAASPVAMAMRDLNHDGRADLVIAHGGGGGVTVLLASATGALTATNLLVGTSFAGLALADLDADTHPDIVITESAAGLVRILRGIGNGAFLPATSFAAGAQPASVAVGDINSDGIPDIVTGNQSGLSATLVMGIGGALFNPPVGSGILGTYHRSLQLEDVDGDGKLDLLAQRESESTVKILHGNGNASFAAAVAVTVGPGANGFLLRDVNVDGVMDLVVALEGTIGVAVLNGIAGGQFAAPIVYGAGGRPSGVAVADFDGDGKLDIAAATFLSNGIAVLRGLGMAGFSAATILDGPNYVGASTIGDFNNDGHPDVVVVNSGFLPPRNFIGNAVIALGDGHGGFSGGGSQLIGTNPAGIATADFNNDGHLDFVATNGFLAGIAQVALGNGSGGIASAVTLFASGTDRTSAVAAGDVNGDGKPDVVVANSALGNVNIFLGNGDGTFQGARNQASGGNVNYGLLVLDVDGDGKRDIVASNQGASVSVTYGKGDGTFQTPVSTIVGSGPGRLSTGDFNGDGRPDFAVLVALGRVSVVTGQATGALLLVTSFIAHPEASSIDVGDIDGDGKLDIVTGNGVSGTVTVARGNGDGTFGPPETFHAGGFHVKSISVADFNGDGRPDVLAFTEDDAPTSIGNVNLMLNRTPAPCGSTQAGDCDGDGIPDSLEAGEGRDPSLKDNDVFGSARLFTMQQYRDFLAREGDAAGIQGWVNLINAGTYSRLQVIDAFLSSNEFAGFVAPVVRLYFATFLRIPDYAGFVFNTGLVRNGTVTVTQLAEFFTVSPEFQATYGTLDNAHFVALLYNNVLDRAPDAAGLAGWVGLLQSGYTRGQVLIGFSDSAEFQAITANDVFVTLMYTGMLRRSPEPAGFTAWTGLLNAATLTRAQVINGFFLSTEYHGRFLP